MNEADQFRAMLTRVGIEHAQEGVIEDEDFPAAASVVKVQNTKGQGYGFFFSEWYFDADGMLLGVAHWE